MRFLLLLSCYLSLALALVEPNEQYDQIQTPSQDVIFEHHDHEDARHFINTAKQIHNDYQKSFGLTLSQKNYTVMASDHNQIANGMATFLPLLSNEFYSGGASRMDYFSTTSWLDQLTIHELAHTYQLDAKHSFSLTLQHIFGNNGAWFINPNYLLPTLVIEGNAVMNESHFDIGGRLFSGVHRATVYALAHQKALNYSRLLNNHLSFPYTSEKYLVGGYFWSYLVARFGLNRANQFFYTHSKHYLNPLRVNTSFKEHFGITFKEAINAFITQLEEEAQKMHYLKGEALSSAQFIAPLNRINDKIVWIDTPETGPNRLNLFKANRLQQKKSSLALGKVFEIKKKLLSSAQLRDSATTITSGLFDAKRAIVPRSRNFFYYDIRKHHTAKADISDSYQQAALYKDQNYIAKSVTEAILDNNGSIYYAKQQGAVRTIYKDAHALFHFKGYFDRLLEVRKGILYFIASTPLGASLFSFDGHKTYRLSRADNITDARMLDNRHFLAVTVQADGYHILKSTVDGHTEAVPAYYHYAFKTTPLKQMLQTKSAQTKPYSPFKNLKFATFTPFFYTDTQNGGIDYFIAGHFTDPMRRQTLDLILYDLYQTQAQALTFIDYSHRLNYLATLIYTQEAKQNLLAASLSGRYALAQNSQNRLSLSSGLQNYQYNPDFFYLFATLQYSHFEHYGIAYDYHNKFTFSTTIQSGNLGSILKTDLGYTHQLLNNLFFNYTQNLTVAHKTNITLQVGANLLHDASMLTVIDPTLWIDTPYLTQLSAQLHRPFNAALYGDIIPLGLRRLDPIAGLSYTAVAEHDFASYFTGLEAEFLAVHLTPFKVKLLYNYNTYTKNRFYTLSIGASF